MARQVLFLPVPPLLSSVNWAPGVRQREWVASLSQFSEEMTVLVTYTGHQRESERTANMESLPQACVGSPPLLKPQGV